MGLQEEREAAAMKARRIGLTAVAGAMGLGLLLGSSLGTSQVVQVASAAVPAHVVEVVQATDAYGDILGSWVVYSDGRVAPQGVAPFYGDASHIRGVADIVGMIPASTGRGYYLVGADGGVFAFGAAPYYGSVPGSPAMRRWTAGLIFSGGWACPALNKGGSGYVLVASNGTEFHFGPAAGCESVQP